MAWPEAFSPYQATTESPSASEATSGYNWLPAVVELTRKSGPTGAKARSARGSRDSIPGRGGRNRLTDFSRWV